MAEGSRRSAGDDEPAGGSSDLFARVLGDTWVEIEPGIYERRPAPREQAAPSHEKETIPQEPEPPARRSGR